MYGWIKAEEYSFDSMTLFDKWIVRYLMGLAWNGTGYYPDPEYRKQLGIALKYNPHVVWYFTHKCPETAQRVAELCDAAPEGLTAAEVRASECWVMQRIECFMVYIYPEAMERCDYNSAFDPQTLLGMADFTDKVVLDVGSGTGRLAFAAAPVARHVYASEPIDELREYMREKRVRLGCKNVTVVDGLAEEIPYPDDTFDIVTSGHVVGDDYERELGEMTRVVKDGGYIILCDGESAHVDPGKPADKLRGFTELRHQSPLGGEVCRYVKQVRK